MLPPLILIFLIAILLVAIIFFAVQIIPDAQAQKFARIFGYIFILLWAAASLLRGSPYGVM